MTSKGMQPSRVWKQSNRERQVKATVPLLRGFSYDASNAVAEIYDPGMTLDGLNPIRDGQGWPLLVTIVTN